MSRLEGVGSADTARRYGYADDLVAVSKAFAFHTERNGLLVCIASAATRKILWKSAHSIARVRCPPLAQSGSPRCDGCL